MPIIPTPPPISGNYIKSKPVVVMRFRNSMSDMEFSHVKDTLWKSDISKEYNIIAIKNDKDKDEFEMYNADKIERQDWNSLVNKVVNGK